MIRNPACQREIEFAWAAGIIDGEGCLIIQPRQPKKAHWSIEHRLTLRVKMCHRPTLDRLHQIFGVGGVFPRKKQQEHHLQPWEWLVYRLDAISVVETILPYLMTKREEADVFRSFPRLANLPVGTPLPDSMIARRERFRQRLSELKRQEWPR